MAKRWSAVTRSLWSDARFLSLSSPKPSAQTLWLYLLTGPHQGPIPGLFPLGAGAIADGLGWTLKEVRSALAEVEGAGMALICERPALIFLPRAVTHNQPANPNMIKGWRSHWDELPECPLRDRALFTIFRSIKETMKPSFSKVFQDEMREAHARPVSPDQPSPGNGLPNGMPNNDQDQDQEIYSPTLLQPEESPEALSRTQKRPDYPEALDLALALKKAIQTHSDAYAAKIDDKQISSWAMLIERMIRRDQAKPDEIRAVIQWAHIDDPKGFWQPNLLSASSLRKQFPRLLLQAKKAGAIQRVVDEDQWKTEHGTWAIRVGQRTVITGGSFTGAALIAAARLEGVPIPEPGAAGRIASWAATRP